MMKPNFVLLALLAGSAIAAPVASAQQPPDYYVGAGVRAGFNDPTSFVIDSKAKLTDLGNAATLSVRPSVLFDNNTELRLPVSVDFAVADGFYPYGGAGVAYNAGGRSAVDAMITGGLDWGIAQNLVLDLNVSMLFKPGNADTEFTATINYAF
ncbi:hypothetical protein [Nodosilinea sp. E11]|uniref:hypothetical protein n=1 Tax=Nodosilinea sp. E11 TaxID=3037479 RepID=UPI002934630C|nr:hypothetical protein [Nodosilinea sp. E11]WOD41355.1 hypothetical protein RRF56_11175 [Nodosilinea sp. E11]